MLNGRNRADETEGKARPQRIVVLPSMAVPTIGNPPAVASSSPTANFDISTERGLEAWVHSMWLKDRFNPDGTSRGYKWFKSHLISQAQGKKGRIRQAVNK